MATANELWNSTNYTKVQHSKASLSSYLGKKITKIGGTVFASVIWQKKKIKKKTPPTTTFEYFHFLINSFD